MEREMIDTKAVNQCESVIERKCKGPPMITMGSCNKNIANKLRLPKIMKIPDSLLRSTEGDMSPSRICSIVCTMN